MSIIKYCSEIANIRENKPRINLAEAFLYFCLLVCLFVYFSLDVTDLTQVG